MNFRLKNIESWAASIAEAVTYSADIMDGQSTRVDSVDEEIQVMKDKLEANDDTHLGTSTQP